MSKELDDAYRKLESLVSWHEYYSAVKNPIEANKTQRQIEDQKRVIKQIKEVQNGKTQKVIK